MDTKPAKPLRPTRTAEEFIAHIVQAVANTRAEMEAGGATDPTVTEVALHAARVAQKVLTAGYDWSADAAEHAARSAVRTGLGDSAVARLFDDRRVLQ